MGWVAPAPATAGGELAAAGTFAMAGKAWGTGTRSGGVVGGGRRRHGPWRHVSNPQKEKGAEQVPRGQTVFCKPLEARVPCYLFSGEEPLAALQVHRDFLPKSRQRLFPSPLKR